MTSNELICLFCKTYVLDGFSIFGHIGDEEDAVEIIEQHFWFDVIYSPMSYSLQCNKYFDSFTFRPNRSI